MKVTFANMSAYVMWWDILIILRISSISSRIRLRNKSINESDSYIFLGDSAVAFLGEEKDTDFHLFIYFLLEWNLTISFSLVGYTGH